MTSSEFASTFFSSETDEWSTPWNIFAAQDDLISSIGTRKWAAL